MATIDELRAQLQEAEQAEALAESQRRIVEQAGWDAITDNPDSYEWRAAKPRYRAYGTPEGADEVAVECRIKPEVYEAFIASGGMSRAFCLNWHGMVYHRTEEDILTHGGGGSYILCDPMLCNDDEWQAIKAGNPAAKYRKPWAKS